MTNQTLQLFAVNKTDNQIIFKGGYKVIPRRGYIPITDEDLTHPHLIHAVGANWVEVTDRVPELVKVPTIDELASDGSNGVASFVDDKSVSSSNLADLLPPEAVFSDEAPDTEQEPPVEAAENIPAPVDLVPQESTEPAEPVKAKRTKAPKAESIPALPPETENTTPTGEWS